MGEIADMHLDGTMCEGCGAFFDDVLAGNEPPGYPRLCWDCAEDELCCPRCRSEEIKPNHKYCMICGFKLNNHGFLRAIKKAHLSE